MYLLRRPGYTRFSSPTDTGAQPSHTTGGGSRRGALSVYKEGQHLVFARVLMSSKRLYQEACEPFLQINSQGAIKIIIISQKYCHLLW